MALRTQRPATAVRSVVSTNGPAQTKKSLAGKGTSVPGGGAQPRTGSAPAGDRGASPAPGRSPAGDRGLSTLPGRGGPAAERGASAKQQPSRARSPSPRSSKDTGARGGPEAKRSPPRPPHSGRDSQNSSRPDPAAVRIVEDTVAIRARSDCSVSPGGSRSSSPGRPKHRRDNADPQALSNIKVCVRIRPLSASEEERGETNCTVVDSDCGVSVQMMRPVGEDFDQGERHPTFSFDWVLSSKASQQMVYNLLGQRLVQGVADGFHACVFAHGQTGSGKSHTIFGGDREDEQGLLPHLSSGLFQELDKGQDQYLVKLSYLEIYNEKLHDLLRPVGGKKPPVLLVADGAETNRSSPGRQMSTSETEEVELQIRHHPKFGVFVEGLTSNAVQSDADVKRLLDYGHKIRVVGSTNMNACSSRSHAIVTLNVELNISQAGTGLIRRRASLHMVDLAGSERMKQVGVHDKRKDETIEQTKNINKSLSSLSLVISKLAEQEQSPRTGHAHVPVRNSKLTHILSDSLMGNCKTVMLACVSPVSSSFGVSISTLRFAAAAKKIRTQPVRNEELEKNLVANLRAEIDALTADLNWLREAGEDAVTSEKKEDLKYKLRTTMILQESLCSSFADEQAKATHLERARTKTLANLGLTSANMAELANQSSIASAEPYLVNVCDDPLLSGRLIYPLPRGEVARIGSSPLCEIPLEGLGGQLEMCRITWDGRAVEVYVGSGADHHGADAEKGGRQSAEGRGLKSRSPKQAKPVLATLEEAHERRVPRGSLFKSSVPQVFVNNRLVQTIAQLSHRECLRIGRTRIFQLLIPTDEEHAKALVLDSGARSVGEQHLLHDYTAHLRRRLGASRAGVVFDRLAEITQLVDEANELTEELRGDEINELVFKAHILTDAMHNDQDPEIAVVLNICEKPSEIGESGQLIFAHGRLPEGFSIVWSEDKFCQRLEVLRDLHKQVSERELPWGQLHDLDPWRDESGISSVGGEPVSILGSEHESPLHSESILQRASLTDDQGPRPGAYEELMSQHERALDFISKREVDIQRVLADLEARLEESQRRAEVSEAARDQAREQALCQIPAVELELELQTVRAERDALALRCRELCQAAASETPIALGSRPPVAEPPARSVATTSAPTLPLAQASVLPPGTTRGVSPSRMRAPAYPGASSTLPMAQVSVQRAGHAVVPAPTADSVQVRAGTPVRLIASARSMTPGRIPAQAMNTQINGVVAGQGNSGTTTTQANGVNAVMRQRQIHGELSTMRQELQSLTDFCHKLDEDVPARPQERRYGTEMQNSSMPRTSNLTVVGGR